MTPPCIRALKRFEKTGCPERTWDGKEGCPAWVEMLVTPKDEPMKPKDKIGKCIDLWQLELTLKSLGLLEGNQQATESFRNGMLEQDRDGNPRPKPDPGTVAILKFIQTAINRQVIITQHKATELAEG